VNAGVIEPNATGAVTGWPRFWLKLEGFGAFVGAATAFSLLGGSPVVFIVALLVVDVSMIGYLRSPAWGAVTYNLAHNWFTALAVLGLGYGTGTPGLVLAGCVLIAHVGGDRLAGYGLKYPGAFGDTHLGWIGRRRS